MRRARQKQRPACGSPPVLGGAGGVERQLAPNARSFKSLSFGAKLDNLSERAIKESVVKKVHPEAKLDGLPDAYVDGRFAAALEAFARSDSSLEKLRAALPPPKPGERVDSVASDARVRMILQLERAHQAPCSSARE